MVSAIRETDSMEAVSAVPKCGSEVERQACDLSRAFESKRSCSILLPIIEADHSPCPWNCRLARIRSARIRAHLRRLGHTLVVGTRAGAAEVVIGCILPLRSQHSIALPTLQEHTPRACRSRLVACGRLYAVGQDAPTDAMAP